MVLKIHFAYSRELPPPSEKDSALFPLPSLVPNLPRRVPPLLLSSIGNVEARPSCWAAPSTTPCQLPLRSAYIWLPEPAHAVRSSEREQPAGSSGGDGWAAALRTGPGHCLGQLFLWFIKRTVASCHYHCIPAIVSKYLWAELLGINYWSIRKKNKINKPWISGPLTTGESSGIKPLEFWLTKSKANNGKCEDSKKHFFSWSLTY